MHDMRENQTFGREEIFGMKSRRAFLPVLEDSVHRMDADGNKEYFPAQKKESVDFKGRISAFLLAKSRNEQSLSQRTLKLLGYFLIIMLIFTLISRSAYTLTLPQVQTTKLASMPITHRVDLDGMLEANEQVVVSAQMGIMISSVFVKVGDRVEEGQLLFQYDREALDERISHASVTVAKANLSLEEARDGVEAAEQQREISIARAQEDYALAKDNGTLDVTRAETAMLEARSLYDEQPSDEFRKTYEEAKNAYDTSVESAEESKRIAARALEDAYSITVTGNSQIESLSLDLDEANKVLSSLVELQDASGNVYASTNGIVADVLVAVGSEASGPSAMLVADTSQGYRLECTASPEQAKYIDVGDEVTVTVAGDTKGMKTAVSGKIESTGQAGWYIVSTNVPADYVAGSLTAHLQCLKSGGRYSAVVPVESIVSFSENGNQAQYIFILDEKNTVLGVETVVRRVDVEVIEQNDHYAAVEGPISEEQRIVCSSNRELNEGDRVREVLP